MGKKEDKTNVMRILDKKNITYNYYSYDIVKLNFIDVANSRGRDLATVFKTLYCRKNLCKDFVYFKINLDRIYILYNIPK